MEADLVARAGLPFEAIPAAGVHGVGLRRLVGNSLQTLRGIAAARGILRRFRPGVMFFTGGYVAPPMAVAGKLAGMQIPSLLYVPDIEPGLALKFLSRFADCIAVTAEESRRYFPARKRVIVTGYPIRPGLSAWDRAEAYRAFDLSPDLPVLLVTGGSLGALSINQAIAGALPGLLAEMQIIHLTGSKTWPQFESVPGGLTPVQAARYRLYPYLHETMGAAFTIADLVVSRAGASSIGEYPHFGIPAILIPYPYAWRYQRVNASYLARQGAAVVLEDAELPEKIAGLVLGLIRDVEKRKAMKAQMQSLARPDAASALASAINDLASAKAGARK